ncbi:MAG: hypothetical protein V3V20_09865 [Algisphaera sp.]
MARTSRTLRFSTVFALLTTALLLTEGCAAPHPHSTASRPAWNGRGGGVDLGPLTDAAGRRRSLALAPSGASSHSAFYTTRNDIHRSVTAGYATPTFHSARTVTIDRGPGRGHGGHGRFSHHESGLHNGYSTRTIRRSSTQAVR